MTGAPSLPRELRLELKRFAACAAAAREDAPDPATVLATLRDPFSALIGSARSTGWTQEGRRLLLVCPAITIFTIGTLPGYLGEIHDHGVWGLVGQIEGVELELTFQPGASDDGGISLDLIALHRLTPGDVTFIQPPERDIHQVINNSAAPSVTLHAFAHDLVTEGFNMYRSGPHKMFPYRGTWLDSEVAL